MRHSWRTKPWGRCKLESARMRFALLTSQEGERGADEQTYYVFCLHQTQQTDGAVPI